MIKGKIPPRDNQGKKDQNFLLSFVTPSRQLVYKKNKRVASIAKQTSTFAFLHLFF